MDIIDKIFGNYSERQVKKIIPIAEKIMSLDEEYGKLTDEELKNKTIEFKEKISQGKTLDDILIDAFATVREASWRILKMKHYKEQLIGGIVLHQGRIAEMKTGEGKTLVATLPAYLNALEGKGVHVITVNDYLAERDKEEMGQVYEFLGLTTGVVLNQMQAPERRAAYNSDITYGTNSEYGFDYLRDNMVVRKEEKVQRPLNFAIVDEVDSIFVDEARTPLIISGEGKESTEFYKIADHFAKTLILEEDYTIDEKTKAVILSEQGVEKAEIYYGVENFADDVNLSLQHHTVQALKANYGMKNSVDYIVRDGEILIVDSFTGRVMDGRRFSDGLHQAIEAKEEVDIKEENQTLATITYQNYFKIYNKISGMTGTAQTEEEEFREVYGLDVVVIPTHKPIKRIDRDDLMYKTEMDKFKAIVNDIVETHKKGQPTLVGTTSIEKSELISFMLKRRGVPHQVLNAKHHKKEAEIVSHAGEVGAVTIATNMAGRGTDIKLTKEAEERGGLKVIGTERHESRRIDNQLRGRSGRQGDVGESIFYISLEDEIIKRFAPERLENVMSKVKIEEEGPIQIKKVTDLIKHAQKNVEANNFETRKNVLKYDDVMNKQRIIVYKQRNEVLDKEDISKNILYMIKEVMYKETEIHLTEDKNKKLSEKDLENLIKYMEGTFFQVNTFKIEDFKNMTKAEVQETIYKAACEVYSEKEEILKDNLRIMERSILLKVVDYRWIDHLENMENLKQYINLQSYNQKDPSQMYQLMSSDMFDEMIYNIKLDTIKYVLKIEIKLFKTANPESKEENLEEIKIDSSKDQLSKDEVESKEI
ncbi:preprotein translocase subunit SecA [Clostridium amazonitimonense]|uniref:preprotein translocase subunit SecA n=1 Tax=Clostridium amazonitimonense TaxID=1499689 RepID=UPI0005093C44|nr:preprotein translocase subunit SecA [Clostridium amazonitimonense]